MDTTRRLVAVCATATVLLASGTASAQTTLVRPEFLLIVDTSGSMTASTGAGTNSCGYTHTRMNDAACVVRNIADGVGEAIFGMETFGLVCAAAGCHYTFGPNLGCGAINCGALAVPGYPFPFQGCDDGGNLQVSISTALTWDLRTWGDGSWTSCANPSGLSPAATGGNELSNFYNTGCPGAAVSNTPLAGSLRAAWNYLSDRMSAAAPRRPSPYIEFNHNPTTNASDGVDPYPACRPVSVILLTDGGETCTGGTSTPAAQNARNIGCMRIDLNRNGMIENPIPMSDPNPLLRGRFESNIDLNADQDCYDAGEQRAFRTRVYTIGFGVGCNNANIEAISLGGGVPLHTVSCTATPVRGYYAVNEADIATAINDIVDDSALRELCNTVDDNCNGIVDEGYSLGVSCSAGIGACRRLGTTVCNATQDDVRCNAVPGAAAPENTAGACSDGVDNDCDGFTDCGDTDCATFPICTGSCRPMTEICDGLDNDCDGMIDEGNPGGGATCGSSVGACRTGTTACVAGRIVCQGSTGPVAEVCDGIDNNCNGAVDEGISRPCGSSVGECRPGVEQCVGGAFSGMCVGSVGPQPEVCDGLDNNCNGMTDEGDPGGGAMCGTSGIGICTGGTVRCVMGRLTCTGGTLPRMEICNGIDDDCNGVIDDGVTGVGAACDGGIMFPTSPPMGVCTRGTTACVMGAIVCRGAVGPSMEICNGMDDNCNGMIDEGLAGGMCGSSVGACRMGTLRCVMGRSVCDGAVMAMPEVCDNVDNDCDGEVDEGNPGGGARCGSDVGECRPGVMLCRMGRLECDGARGMMPEVCDGLDNDCDGSIDEDLPAGGPCGSMVGECRQGTSRCIGGRMVCEGGVGPRPEECNCRDDDCDGMIDNNPAMGSGLCGSDAVCAGAPHCQCLRPCGSGEFPCPVGRTCQNVGGRDLCVGDLCLGVSCDPRSQTCENGVCRNRCEGVTCDAPLVCNPATGRCVENDCRALNNCPMGQICRMDAARRTFTCVNDPCASVVCSGDTPVCYDGVCGRSCTGVNCPTGQACHRGMCQSELCAARTTPCATGEICNPANGMCESDRCRNRSCGANSRCDPATGDCVDDPCATVRCRATEVCRLTPMGASCESPPAPPPPRADRVVGTGAGGVGCAVAGATPGSTRGRDVPRTMFAVAFGLAAIATRIRARAKRRKQNGSVRGEVVR